MANKGKFATWNHLVGSSREIAVINFFDPTVATPAEPKAGDRYIAAATANGWTINRINEWDGDSWIENAPAANTQVEVIDRSAEYLWLSGAWTLISRPMRVGRNAYLEADDVPPSRGAEWNGVGQNQHTIRRGRASWAKARS